MTLTETNVLHLVYQCPSCWTTSSSSSGTTPEPYLKPAGYKRL